MARNYRIGSGGIHQFWGILFSATAIGCCGTVAGFLGWLGWPFELAGHFRAQYAVFLTASALTLAVGKKYRATTLAGFFALVNLSLIVPLYVGSPSSADNGTQTYRALLLNVNQSNRAYDKFREFVRAADPDFMVLVEVDAAWMSELRKLRAEYPFTQSRPRENYSGVALLSRLPFEHAEVRYLAGPNIPAVVARFDLGGRPLTAIGVHPPPPFSARCRQPDAGRIALDLAHPLRCRNEQLAGLARFVSQQAGPVMVLGDLNTTSWSPHFQDLLRRGGLRDSRRGFGLQPTWPAYFPPLWLPIDHVLTSPGVIVHNRRVGPNIGSDHYAVIVAFSVGGYHAWETSTHSTGRRRAGSTGRTETAVRTRRLRHQPGP